jgi:hypothetical protein
MSSFRLVHGCGDATLMVRRGSTDLVRWGQEHPLAVLNLQGGFNSAAELLFSKFKL